MRPLSAISNADLREFVAIYRDLSPEALTGDGEISPVVWQQHKRRLDAQLQQLQLRLGLAPEQSDEEAVLTEYTERTRHTPTPRKRRFA